ncbi:MAG: WecB/TagA/CpsF family glycosyltransferase [Pontixanthobacter sp.]
MTVRQNFLGFTFDAIDMAAAAAEIVQWAKAPEFRYVVTPNVDHVVARHRCRDGQTHSARAFVQTIESAYDHADLCLCDSRILGRLATLSDIVLPVVPGSDLTAILLAPPHHWKSIAVVGGDEVLRDAIAQRYPAIEWDFHFPPMGLRTDPGARSVVCDFVERSGCDLTIFAVGAPQSEICCDELKRRGRARGVAICVGASLEFLAGIKQRAPLWMQRAGLEWLHRLSSEPGRLWRRYLVDGPRIFAIWWRRRDQSPRR